MTEETNEVEQQQANETDENVSQQAADLNIADLVALKSIVEVASQRGAFKAQELEAVGKTFNKLNNFLESVSKKET